MTYRYRASRGTRGRNPQDPATIHNITGTGNTSPPAARHSSEEDLTGAARIRNAAIELYGEHGFKGVSLKHIAEKAGVSAPLVIHHFGSKTGLRDACDKYVATEFRNRKRQAMYMGPIKHSDMFQLVQASKHLTRYLLRAFLAGGPEMDKLFDQLVDDAVQYTDEAVEMGLVFPCKNQRNRVALMMLQQFGSLMMAQQMQRHFGFDPLSDHPAEAAAYIETIMELYTKPTINGEVYAELIQTASESIEQHKHSSAGQSAAEQD